MRRTFSPVAVVVAVTVAMLAGTASAETFELVPSAPALPTPALPSSDIPNEPGGILLPPNVFNAPFAPVRVLSDEQLRELWLRAGGAYGVPWQVLAAINKIETNFGRNMGPSSAGAVGWMQFMPDTWLRWGTDGSGDGIADPWDPEDGVFSAARYLAAAGAHTDLQRAIFAYNHAQWYVDDVLELAALFGGGVGDGAVVFTLDRLGIALDEAQAAVSSVSDELRAAEARAQELSVGVDEVLTMAEDPALLLSDRLVAERDLFSLDAERADAAAEVERLSAELAAAEATLEAARSGAHAASFVPAAGDLLAAPTRADGYVFPVGGGPASVSVGHDHHDYPAADIAAPMGAPVYALADAIVLETVDDGRCGTGLTLQTHDGLVWIYCHLSHRDAAVAPGTYLVSGEWLGLVGSTGNSTGPHLHLGLRPSRYPQEMPWFQEFAGLAFSWQDAPTATPASMGPIFALVPPVAPASEAEDAVIKFTLPRG